MPRFFFRVHDSFGLATDEEGLELRDLEGAQREARDGARSIIADGARQGIVDLSGWVEILDEDGETVLVVPFRGAIKILT